MPKIKSVARQEFDQALEIGKKNLSHARSHSIPKTPTLPPPVIEQVLVENLVQLPQTLTWSSYLCILFILLIWGLLVWQHPYMIYLYPILFLPTVKLFHWWFKNTMVVELDIVVRMYGAGFIVAGGLAWGTEAILMLIGYAIYDKIKGDADESKFWLCVFIFIMVILFMLFEEGIKAFMSNRARKRVRELSETRPDLVNSKANLIYSCSTAVGFATSQCIVYTVLALSYYQDIIDPGLVFAIELILALYFIPIHCLASYLSGIYFTKRDMDSYQRRKSFAQNQRSRSQTQVPVVTEPYLNPLGIIIVGTLVRSLIVFIMASLVATQPPGWKGMWVPLTFLVAALFIKYIKSEEKLLPPEVLKSQGYLYIPFTEQV
jgi:hypothetical protein